MGGGLGNVLNWHVGWRLAKIVEVHQLAIWDWTSLQTGPSIISKDILRGQ